MATNTYTEQEVLAHHGIAGVGGTLIDNAREAGLIYACLGCGSVGGTDPAEGEAARVRTRDAVEWDCCPDSDLIIY